MRCVERRHTKRLRGAIGRNHSCCGYLAANDNSTAYKGDDSDDCDYIATCIASDDAGPDDRAAIRRAIS